MADRTITDAMLVAPASTEHTNLITSLTDVQTKITAACTAGKFGAIVRDQLNNEVVFLAERIASNMKV